MHIWSIWCKVSSVAYIGICFTSEKAVAEESSVDSLTTIEANNVTVRTVRKYAKLTLICPGQPREWRKNDAPLRASNKVFLRHSSAVLEIPKVNKSDEGAYECLDSKNQTLAEFAVQIVGAVAAVVMPRHADAEDGVQVGNKIELECIHTGSITAHWYKDGFLLTYSPRQGKSYIQKGNYSIAQIVISNVQPSDAGSYYCVVPGSAVRSSNSYVLRVNSPPLLLSPAFRFISDYALSKHVVRCEVRGNPKPVVEWYRANPHNLSAVTFNKSTLVLIVSQNSIGVYLCVAKNEFGSVNSTLAVKLQESRKIKRVPKEQNCTTMTHSTILIFDYTPFYKNLKKLTIFRWKKDNRSLLSEKQRYSYETSAAEGIIALLITGVSVSDSGMYACEAEDSVGSTLQASLKLEVSMTVQVGSIAFNDTCNGHQAVVCSTNSTKGAKNTGKKAEISGRLSITIAVILIIAQAMNHNF